MELGLREAVAMVAGGSSGIGLAIARALLEEGASVSIGARDRQRLSDARRELGGGERIHTWPTDVTSDQDVAEWADGVRRTFGGPNLLVANSGGPPPGIATDFTVEDYRQAVEHNMLSSIRLVQTVLPDLRRAPWGRVLFVASLSVRHPIPGLALSNAARPGVVGYAKSLVQALGSCAITVNVLAPGVTRTSRLAAIDEVNLRSVTEQIPLGRIAEPAEVAAVAAFLLSARASFVTGAVIGVDGGAAASTL